jgi:1,3-beta-glucanosyltransferase GAS1
MGANVVRTYAIDPTQNHDACMQLLDAAGIYVISDLSEPDLSINRANPEWNLELYNRYTSAVDALAKYTNVIGFFAGNEVTNNASYTPASAFVKAAVRDTKAYVKSKGYTTGVGYAADDDASIRAEVAAYFNCGNAADGIDFWGYNIYSWCDPSNYVTSGYQNHTEEFSTYNVPVFFAEYGCNTGAANGAAGRDFSEVPVLYGPDMSPVFSGGIVYEYFEETNDFGLVSVAGNKVSKLKDFSAFSSQIHAVHPSTVNAAEYSPTNTAMQACPTVGPEWQVSPSGLPPTPDAEVCSCMVSSLSCVAKANLSSNVLGNLFNYICTASPSACAGFAYNTSNGAYGAYLGCNDQDKLSNAFNAYYLEQNSANTACDFSGNATVVQAQATAASCSSAIASATASGNSTTSGKKSAGSSEHASVAIGGWAWAAYFSTVVLFGLGIFLL